MHLVDDVLERRFVDIRPISVVHSLLPRPQPLHHLVPQLGREVANHHGREWLPANLAQHPAGLFIMHRGGVHLSEESGAETEGSAGESIPSTICEGLSESNVKQCSEYVRIGTGDVLSHQNYRE